MLVFKDFFLLLALNVSQEINNNGLANHAIPETLVMKDNQPKPNSVAPGPIALSRPSTVNPFWVNEQMNKVKLMITVISISRLNSGLYMLNTEYKSV